MALTHLIEAHLALDVHDMSLSFQRHLITWGSKQGLSPAVEQLHFYQPELKEEKFNSYLYLQLMEENTVKSF